MFPNSKGFEDVRRLFYFMILATFIPTKKREARSHRVVLVMNQ